MKKASFAVLAAMFLATPVFADTYTVDPSTAQIQWNASKVTGKHNGRVALKSAALELTDGKLTGGQAVIDMSNIVVDDIQDEASNGKLVGHLKSADFFDVANHPTASLKVTDVKAAAEGRYDVTADLTIKGITKSVAFPVEIKETPEGVSVSAKLTVDRTDFDVRYGSGKFFENLGDKMIHDTFDLEVSGTAKKA